MLVWFRGWNGPRAGSLVFYDSGHPSNRAIIWYENRVCNLFLLASTTQAVFNGFVYLWYGCHLVYEGRSIECLKLVGVFDQMRRFRDGGSGTLIVLGGGRS